MFQDFAGRLQFWHSSKSRTDAALHTVMHNEQHVGLSKFYSRLTDYPARQLVGYNRSGIRILKRYQEFFSRNSAN